MQGQQSYLTAASPVCASHCGCSHAHCIADDNSDVSILPAETRAKIAASHYGKTHSQVTKQKMREARYASLRLKMELERQAER